jgi:hypothetical protein
MWNAAQGLLQRHYSRMNAAKVLELLPAESTKLQAMQVFFESVLRCMAEKRRNNQVLKALLKSENLQVCLLLLLLFFLFVESYSKYLFFYLL